MKVSKLALLFGLTALVPTLSQADTLQDVTKKGVLNCGVSTGIPGFSAADSKGVWKGIDVDFCRSVASAVLGDASKVKYIPLTAKERFTALQSGEIDVLARSSTWTATRDTSLGLNFAGVNYYDGQGFLVSKKLGVTSAKELNGATFCIQAGTTSELNLTDYFKANKMEYKAVTYDTSGQTIDGFKKGRCDAVTSDASQLYSLKLKMDDPKSVLVLPEIISKEPLGPVVRQGDDTWFNIVRWTMFATLEAEELGVMSSNVDKMMKCYGMDLGIVPGKTCDLKKVIKKLDYEEIIKRVERKNIILNHTIVVNKISTLDKFESARSKNIQVSDCLWGDFETLKL